MEKAIIKGIFHKITFYDNFVMLEVEITFPEKQKGHIGGFTMKEKNCCYDFRTATIHEGTPLKITRYADLKLIDVGLKGLDNPDLYVYDIEIMTNAALIQDKYATTSGEIAFRLWMFANAVEVLKASPNQEKAQNLKSKMENFSSFVVEKGTPENLNDIKTLIAEL